MSKSFFKIRQITEAVAGDSCPVASQEPHINAANKASAIQNFLYGPAMPFADNKDYFVAVAQAMNMQPEDVQGARCQNCAYNNNDPAVQECIAVGMGGSESFDPMQTIQKANMGYCQALHFLTEGVKGCSMWVAAVEDQPEQQERQ